MRKISFGGIESCGTRAKSFSRMFDTVCEYDDEAYYSTKKTYHHDDGDNSFDYKYVVKLSDLYDMSGEEEFKGKLYIDLYLLPTNEYLSEETKNEVRSACGMDSDSDIYVSDIIDTTTVPHLCSDSVKAKYWDSKKMRDTKNNIATILNCLDSMRGFYMDKTVNMIGTTNWDILDSCLHGGNPFARALGI